MSVILPSMFSPDATRVRLTHNECRDSYQTVAQEYPAYEPDAWVSEAAYHAACAGNDAWVLHHESTLRSNLLPDLLINAPRDLAWPRHECGLYLERNEHLTPYYDVNGEHFPDFEEWLEMEGTHSEPTFASDEQRAKCISLNESWSLQWYPDTPVGFCKVMACDLDVLMHFVLNDERG